MQLVLIQTDIRWLDPKANQILIDRLLTPLSPDEIDVIVLPEMWNTGFCMEPALAAEGMDGPSAQYMSQLSKKYASVVIGSLAIAENNKYYNRCLFFNNGHYAHHYDKKHLFTLSGEADVYAASHTPDDYIHDGLRIRPRICYDLRFPTWNQGTQAPQLLFFTASWPTQRIAHWDTLLAARAIENQCYVLGVNRIGTDGNNYTYSGHTSIYDYQGVRVAYLDNREGILQYSLNFRKQLDYRKRYPFIADIS